jgi:transposase
MYNNIGKVTLERAAVQTAVTVKIGIDQHAADVVVSVQEDGLPAKRARRMGAEQLIELVQKYVNAAAKVYTAYEAGPCGYWLHRRLEAAGAKNVVVVPQRWDRENRNVKTDKRDALELCNRLDSYLRGNTKAFSLVCVPTPEQEQRRAIGRQRGWLGKERRRCIARAFGVMLSAGIHAESGWHQARSWPLFRERLPLWLREQVEAWRTHAEQLGREEELWTERVEKHANGHIVPKGIGQLTSALLEMEVLDWHRFESRRAIGSYAGLCPSENSSGQSRRQGSISKHGNPRIRHALIEAVWRLLQWQPDYPPIKKLRQAVGSRARRRTAVAAARRLVIDLWRINTHRVTPEQVGLKLQ